MRGFKSILFIVSAILAFCECKFVENLSKCKIDDGDCERDLIQTVIHDIAKTGIEELGIPPVDPIHLKNVSFSILDIMDLTLVEATLKGVKDCKVEKFFTDVKKERASMELSCDHLTLKGHYKVFASNPSFTAILGGDTVSGDGNVKVKVEKLHIKFDYFFYIQQRKDDIYIKCKRDKTVYKYDIGKLTFYVDNLKLGKQDASEMVATLLNQNWQSLMTTFGKSFMDKAMEYVYEFVHKFFDSVPCKYYISEDLSKYAKP